MNGYHQIALFIVLFGGFLAWGEVQRRKFVALEKRLKEWDLAKAWYRKPDGTWFNELFDLEIAELTRRSRYGRPSSHFDIVDSFAFAMNTQQKFNRPWKFPSRELPEELSLTRMMRDLALPGKDEEKKS